MNIDIIFIINVQELLPNVRIANESRELVLNCCSEFIHYIATRANEVCNQHHKKTINAEHILTGKQQRISSSCFVTHLFRVDSDRQCLVGVKHYRDNQVHWYSYNCFGFQIE